MEINKRALGAAKDNAMRQVSRLKNAWANKKINNWADIQPTTGIEVPPLIATRPFGWPAVSMLITYWLESVQQRIESNLRIQQSAEERKVKLTTSSSTETIANVTLLPEQQPVYEAIYKALFEDRRFTAAMQDGTMGSGKTFVAGAIINRAIAKGYHNKPFIAPYRYLIVTRKSVIEGYKRKLEAFGLGPYLGNLILVTSYSQLSAAVGGLLVEEVYDAYKEETILKVNPILCPDVVIWDECHALNHPETKQTKFSLALQRMPTPPVQVFMSATPFVTVNHSRTFVIASKIQWMGMTITEENFKNFAGSLAARPDRPNIAAAKRLRALLADRIFSFPHVRWPHKAINQCLIIPFANEEHRALYNEAYDIFLEKLKYCGQNTEFGQWKAAVALGQFRKAAEPYHTPAIVERIVRANANGKAVIVGYCFRESVAQTVYELARRGYKRSDIAVIWGGKREYKQALLLSDSELEAMLRDSTNIGEYEMRRITETLNYKTERVMKSESAEEQASRLALQKSLGLLGSQSAEQRQTEIDKFQERGALVCIFTLAAGGVGLSLDQDKPSLRPRESYFTPSLSGPEFKQALGRGLRRTTLSDIYQYICWLAGTVEESFMAPLAENKLKCISAFTGNLLNTMDLATMKKIQHSFRTAEQAEADADNEESQLTGNTDEEDPDEDID